MRLAGNNMVKLKRLPIKLNKINLIYLLILIGLISCSKTDSNRLDSDNYDRKEARVQVLKNEIKTFSEIENAEFELFNVNGFSKGRSTIPGASSWDYKFVIKVNSADIDKWTTGFSTMQFSNIDKGWMSKIIEKKPNDWKTNSKPEAYMRKGQNVTMLIYRSEGIIFKRVLRN